MVTEHSFFYVIFLKFHFKNVILLRKKKPLILYPNNIANNNSEFYRFLRQIIDKFLWLTLD